jgi:hypothetical protein
MNKHNTQSGLLRTSTLALALALGASSVAGCGNDDMAEARATVSKVGQALFLSGDVQILKGKYYSCRTHIDGSSWSVANGVSAQGDQVQVVKRNGACQLKIDSMVIDRAGVPTTFTAASAFVMGESYQSEATLFTAGNGEKFYSNLKISDDTYADAFDVSMLFAEDPAAVAESASASFASTTTDQISVAGVPAPDYVYENDALTIPVRSDFSLDADATGGINLNHDSVQGDKYILTQSDPGSTVNALNTFWAANAGAAVSITPGNDLAFGGAADLGLVEDASLASPIVWYVLIANWDASDPGTRSYQKFTITINHP